MKKLPEPDTPESRQKRIEQERSNASKRAKTLHCIWLIGGTMVWIYALGMIFSEFIECYFNDQETARAEAARNKRLHISTPTPAQFHWSR